MIRVMSQHKNHDILVPLHHKHHDSCAVTTQEDYRDIIVTAGEDPYAYRGIANLKQPYVNPHRWLPEPGEPPRPERTEAERDAAWAEAQAARQQLQQLQEQERGQEAGQQRVEAALRAELQQVQMQT